MTLSIEEREAITRHIASLPEMEFVEILKSMAETIRRNKWEHIIDTCFDIETYEHELEATQDEIKELKSDLRDAKNKLSEIRDLL